jgi:hypothetical protein
MRILFLLLFCVVVNSHAQKIKPTLLKSTITSVGGGAMHSITILNKNYNIQQSIGQSSIIGQKNIGKTFVQQGFLINVKVFDIDNTNSDFINNSLMVVISPNPFIDHVKINFSKKTLQDIHIYIYDINGKVLFTKKHKPTDTLIVPMKYYSLGSYLIHIQSGKNKFTRKLLKTVIE